MNYWKGKLINKIEVYNLIKIVRFLLEPIIKNGHWVVAD